MSYIRTGSIAFFIAIPSALIISFLGAATLIKLYQIPTSREETHILFCIGFIGASSIFASTKMPTVRTFLHEVKHSIMIHITGGQVTDFQVNKHTGHVAFKMLQDRTHFAPFIALAPYFFPLLSLPILVVCIALGQNFQALSIILLGSALAVDLVLGYQEIHPSQTDLQRIFGGIIPAYLFIGAFHLMWIIICWIWIIGGNKGFLYMMHTSLYFAQSLADRLA
jgi:hypothetical protein